MSHFSLDVRNLADVVTDDTVTRSALASLPFVAALHYLDREHYARAAQLLSRAEAPSGDNAFSQTARLLRAAAEIYGGNVKAGLALLPKLRSPNQSPTLRWQGAMLQAVGLLLSGEPADARRATLDAAALQASEPQLAAFDGLAQLSEAGILLRMARPIEAIARLEAFDAARLPVCRAAKEQELACLHESAQSNIIYALALTWLGRTQESNASSERASTAASLLLRDLASEQKMVAAAFLAFSVDAPAFLDACGMVHLLALDGPPVPRLETLPADLSELAPTLRQLRLPHAFQTRVQCGLSLAARAGWFEFASLGDDSIGVLDVASNALIRAELQLARTDALIASGRPEIAAQNIDAQLKILDAAFGKGNVASVEWRNRVEEIRMGKRPASNWREAVLPAVRPVGLVRPRKAA